MSKLMVMRIEAPDDEMCEILRLKSEAERLAIAFGMWRFARDMIRANLRQENPDWTTEQVEQQTSRRLSHGTV